VTEDVRLEDDTLTNLECTSPLYPRLGNFKELGHRCDGVTGFDFVFYDTVLLVKVEVTLTNVVCGSPRTHEHHDFKVPLLTLLVGLSFVNLCGIV